MDDYYLVPAPYILAEKVNPSFFPECLLPVCMSFEGFQFSFQVFAFCYLTTLGLHHPVYKLTDGSDLA